jgi:hypothetical protein
MEVNQMIRKWLAVGIILLFIGVAVAPSINQSDVKASNDNDLVEVTTQACGIKGYGNTTVKLTREQYQNLEQYLVDFRARLNQTSTREEAVPIFKEAVVELDRYGLLPKGISVEQAQKLVIGVEPSEKTQECIKKFLDRNPRGNPNNTLCLLAGNVDNAWFWSLFTFTSAAAFIFLLLLFFFLDYIHIIPLNTVEAIPLLIPMALGIYGLFLKPINLFSIIDFTPSARGSIYSIGFSGSYNITGQFEGNINGFTGIRIMRLFHFNPPPIYFSPGGAFFLGSALSISLQVKD